MEIKLSFYEASKSYTVDIADVIIEELAVVIKLRDARLAAVREIKLNRYEVAWLAEVAAKLPPAQDKGIYESEEDVRKRTT